MGTHSFSTKDLIDLDGSVNISHGAGGILSQALIDFLIKSIKKKNLADGIGLKELDDGATIPIPNNDKLVVVSSDGHTVDPLIFPGGDLGKLSVCGAVNDILVMGADPIALTHVLIIEEGFSIKDLKALHDSFVNTVDEAGIAVIAGDTKVMPKGTLNGCISATTSIGFVDKKNLITDAGVQPGDDIVVTGTLGDHGMSLIACRKGMEFETDLISDVHLLNRVVDIARKYNPRAMKDPTRGGLAVALNDFASKSGVSIWLDEDNVPFNETTVSACEMLGLSPYELASEGKAVISVPEGKGQELVKELRNLPESKDAAVIGTAKSEKTGKVFIKTRIGGTRILSVPIGEPIPRVC
ncbi:MAG: hydrogenase expression/formation protein HypE [Candidatus Hodarchaeota archaeon]